MKKYDIRTIKPENYLQSYTTNLYKEKTKYDQEKPRSPAPVFYSQIRTVKNFKTRAQLRYKQKPRKYKHRTSKKRK